MKATPEIRRRRDVYIAGNPSAIADTPFKEEFIDGRRRAVLPNNNFLKTSTELEGNLRNDLLKPFYVNLGGRWVEAHDVLEMGMGEENY